MSGYLITSPTQIQGIVDSNPWILGYSSVVEQEAVNFLVPGSSPGIPAIILFCG